MNLNDCAAKYGTDKQIKKHGYVKYYEKWLEVKRNDKIKLLEIGVERGRSHLMWKDYMPNAMIYGLDIDAGCLAIKQDRIHIEVGSSTNDNFSNKFCYTNGPFDVIIDDGCHCSSAQIKTFELFFQHVIKGGLYIVEDLHTSYWKDFTPLGEKTCVSYLRDLVETINGDGKVYLDGSGELGNANMDDIIKTVPNLNYYETNIESITFYKSLCFIQKR
jgi:hypothetical protein